LDAEVVMRNLIEGSLS